MIERSFHQPARTSQRRRVVIVGAGFAGLAAAQALAGRPLDVTLVDRANHHVFQPLLYQVATAGLPAPAIASPIRHIMRHARNVTTLLADVQRIETVERRLRFEDGTMLSYDDLIVATGAMHSYFGRDDWRPFAPGLKTLDDALEIRRRVLLAFEQAEREPIPERRRAWLTFAVVGAGPTGVELAGTLAEIARHTLRREFRRIDPAEARVVLIEAGERVLPTYPRHASEDACRQLRRLHVDVRTGERVLDIDDDGLLLATERIPARTALWAAGVTASPLGARLDAPCDRAGRILVAPDLSLPGHPEIFVAGDLAHVQANDAVVPANAPAAKQMGRCAAENVLRRAAGKPALAFVYRDHGSLATIGRAAAVAVRGRLSLSGRTAWLLWLCAHIYFLIGFRNKLLVMVEWCWAYVTFERHARIILRLQRD